MSINTDNFVGLSRRIDKKVYALDIPPLGHLQALILKTFELHGGESSGRGVIEYLCLVCGVLIDQPQVYSTIRKLAKRGLLLANGEVKEKRRGPPKIIYKLTEKGKDEIKETLRHYRELSEFLSNSMDKLEKVDARE